MPKSTVDLAQQWLWTSNATHITWTRWAEHLLKYHTNWINLHFASVLQVHHLQWLLLLVSSRLSSLDIRSIYLECLWITSTVWIMCGRLLKMFVAATNLYTERTEHRESPTHSRVIIFDFISTGICIQMQIKRHTFRFVHVAFSVLFS